MLLLLGFVLERVLPGCFWVYRVEIKPATPSRRALGLQALEPLAERPNTVHRSSSELHTTWLV